MNTAGVGRIVSVIVLLATAVPARGLLIGGGGSPSSDCLVAFDVDANFPIDAPKQVRCVDGDPNCDDDKTVNGICNLRVRVCANSTYSSECTISGVSQINVDHSFDNGNDPKFDPDFLALRQRIGSDFMFPVTGADTCTGSVIFTVPIKGPLGDNNCSRQKKKLKLHSVSQPAAGPVTDTDTLKLYCDPAPLDGCNPQKLFASTLDRIQKQVFDRSCALGGCHDSQTQAAALLLETGASYDNLVNQVPTTVPAANAGWLLVRPSDTDASFLIYKLEGDLPDVTYGVRMPRDRPKLNGTLRDIIRRWIEAGAPKDTWVPGTF